jgi:hypothetical protein
MIKILENITSFFYHLFFCLESSLEEERVSIVELLVEQQAGHLFLVS